MAAGSDAAARKVEQVTMVASPPHALGVANGASDHPALSQDNRDVRLLAYDSTASNLVGGDTNGRRDVLVLEKSRGAGALGGRLVRVSVGVKRRQANGDSSYPSVDGTTGWVPRCVAFQSTATNLVRQDRSADSDVYVRDLRNRTTTLVSPHINGAGGASIDGRCRMVAFQAQGGVLVRDIAAETTRAVARGGDPDLQTDGRGVAYTRAGQIYYRELSPSAKGIKAVGREYLVSNNSKGHPGNGYSAHPAVDDHGKHIAFDSTATDLCTDRCPVGPFFPMPNTSAPSLQPGGYPNRDANGPIRDVFRRTMETSARGPGPMDLISYYGGQDQGNGPSHDPVISRAGENIAFVSEATNFPGVGPFTDQNGQLSDVYTWYFDRRLYVRLGKISIQSVDGAPFSPSAAFDGASRNPALSSRGNYIAFASTQTGKSGDRNGTTPDVFLRFLGRSHEGLPTG
jgi:hypothetical protein